MAPRTRSLMPKLFSFPHPVNETSARVVATGVVTMATAAVVLDQPWLMVPITYGFAARVATGPTLSPLGQLATRVVTPRLRIEHRYSPGPPKRLAQAMGLAMSGAALALHYRFGRPRAAKRGPRRPDRRRGPRSRFRDLPRLPPVQRRDEAGNRARLGLRRVCRYLESRRGRAAQARRTGRRRLRRNERPLRRPCPSLQFALAATKRVKRTAAGTAATRLSPHGGWSERPPTVRPTRS